MIFAIFSGNIAFLILLIDIIESIVTAKQASRLPQNPSRYAQTKPNSHEKKTLRLPDFYLAPYAAESGTRKHF